MKTLTREEIEECVSGWGTVITAEKLVEILVEIEETRRQKG